MFGSTLSIYPSANFHPELEITKGFLSHVTPLKHPFPGEPAFPILAEFTSEQALFFPATDDRS